MSSTRVKYLSPRFLDDKLKAEKAYWLEKLSGEPLVTGIPLDYARPPEYTAEKRALALDLDPETQAGLARLCNGNDALVFAVVVTALKICLHKYTGSEDITVGTAIHKRYAEVASLNKVLALRDRVEGGSTVRQLLLGVKRTLTEAYANQKYPFDRIVDLLKIEWPNNREPLFNVAAVLENVGLAENVRDLRTDINLVLALEGGVVSGRVEYNPSLFKEETVGVFRGHFAEILRAVVRDPDARVASLELLAPGQREGLLFAFNETRRDFPTGETIHALFERQAGMTPDRDAVVCGGRSLTYAELNARANRTARRLERLGVRPGDRVGIFMEHSPEMLVGLLGALKAGAAYLPLEPAYPKSRLAFMIEDATAPAVLTQARLVSELPECGARAVCLDEDEEEGSGADENPEGRAAPRDLAYVIYTSGSTGEPKGVEITHSSLVNYILWAAEVYLHGDRLDFALYSSLAFDLTVTSVFTPLVTGNTIFVYPNDGTENPLLAIVQEDRVGVLKLTPSHLSLIRGRELRARGVRRLIVGGEAFETKLAGQIRECFGEDLEIYNEYGPTEATVGCMIHRFDPAADDRAFVPVGRPAANTQIYVLDGELKPVATNIVGELYIAGAGLARGYLDRPELTAQRFVDNPFAPGRKMYKTGDVARWLPEGIIEYVGRKDEQVKFHGYRVELNEIRGALNQHPEVEDSAVAVVADDNGNDVMVAYYVSAHELEAGELRAFMLERVIEETVPNLFARIERLPLTVNGKVDTRALPSLEQVRQAARRTFVAPRNLTEEVLANVWGQVLGLERVSVNDDFFELGGHSLVASQIISRTRKAFQVEVPLRSLFESPTVAGMAEAIEAARRGQLGLTPPPPLVRVPRDGPLPVSFSQQRIWFMDLLQPGNIAYNIYPSFRLTGQLDAEALAKSLDDIVARHESLRTVFTSVDGQPAQVVTPPASLELPVRDLRSLPEPEREAEVRRLTKEEAHRPFDLAEGPLFRAVLLRLADEEHLLILSMHHIVSDGWSMTVLYRELTTLYRAHSAGVPATLPDLPIQYADYAVWQRRWLQGEALATQVSYWRKQLSGAPPALNLRTSRPRAARDTGEGAYQGVTLPRELSDSLKALSRQEGTTLFMTLLAAFKAWLRYYSGSDDIVVGSDVANRNRTEVENLIGFFVNTLVLRADLSGNPTFRELLGRVREVCLAAYAHQDLTFEKLVEELNPPREVNRNPLFQVMFGLLQEDPREALSLPGLGIKPLGVDNSTAVYDFSLYMIDREAGLAGSVRFNTSLFDRATVTRMLANFEELLTRVASRPDLRLAELFDILAAADKQQQTFQAEELREARLQKFKKIRQQPLGASALEHQ